MGKINIFQTIKVVINTVQYTYKLNKAQKNFIEMPELPGYDIDVALYQ